jgi:phosphoglycolate phosphatase
MTIKVIIFDFDGTIADTYQAVVAITNDLSSEFGYKPLDEETLLLLKNLSSKEIVKQSEISLFKLPFLVKRIQTELGKQIENLETIPGMSEVLQELKRQNYILGIITSNAKENVIAFLQKQNLLPLFDFIYSRTSLFGKHRIINKAMKRYKFNTKQVIYVGDETRDIRSAKKSNVGMIAVTWGFHSDKILSQYQPDFLAEKPSEILDAILEL